MEVIEKDGKRFVQISEDDYNDLQKQFDRGYKKGNQNGRRDALKLFDFLELEADEFVSEGNTAKIGEAVKALTQPLNDLKNGKLPEDIAKKLNDKEGVIADLQKKLQEKDRAITETENRYNGFREKTLKENKLRDLALTSKAVDADDVISSFYRNYDVKIAENDQLIIRKLDGTPVTDGRGNELDLAQVFDQFKSSKTHLFAGAQNGGSGDSPPNSSNGSNDVSKMKSDDFHKLVDSVKMGKKVNLE